MEFVIQSIKFKPYHPAWENFRQSRDEPIGKDLLRRAKIVQLGAKRSAPKRTGALAASIYVDYFRGVTNPHVIIGSNVRHAYYVHEGTKPHLIYPQFARVLRFVENGKVTYTRKPVMHPGTRPTHFLSKHLRVAIK